jgi:hypothetical protein
MAEQKNRLLVREMARELTADEVKIVAGGGDAPATLFTWVCDLETGKDIKLRIVDP